MVLSSDSAFNQSLLQTLNTSNPALRLTYQLAFNTQSRTLLVADQGNNRLVSFGTTSPYSALIVGGQQFFTYVSGVAVASDGTIWAGETSSLGVLHLDASGAVILHNVTGSQLTTLAISAMAIDDTSGAVFASDTFTGRVVKIDAASGTLMQVYNSSTTNTTWQPWGLAFFSGYLYVGDCASSTVMKLAISSSSIIQQYDVQNGLPFRSCPTGLAFDRFGNMYVADTRRVWKIDPVSGVLLAMWNFTTTNIRTFAAYGVTLDSGLLYISAGDRVLLFSDLNQNAAVGWVPSLLTPWLVVATLHFGLWASRKV